MPEHKDHVSMLRRVEERLLPLFRAVAKGDNPDTVATYAAAAAVEVAREVPVVPRGGWKKPKPNGTGSSQRYGRLRRTIPTAHRSHSGNASVRL